MPHRCTSHCAIRCTTSNMSLSSCFANPVCMVGLACSVCCSLPIWVPEGVLWRGWVSFCNGPRLARTRTRSSRTGSQEPYGKVRIEMEVCCASCAGLTGPRSWSCSSLGSTCAARGFVCAGPSQNDKWGMDFVGACQEGRTCLNNRAGAGVRILDSLPL